MCRLVLPHGGAIISTPVLYLVKLTDVYKQKYLMPGEKSKCNGFCFLIGEKPYVLLFEGMGDPTGHTYAMVYKAFTALVQEGFYDFSQTSKHCEWKLFELDNVKFKDIEASTLWCDEILR